MNRVFLSSYLNTGLTFLEKKVFKPLTDTQKKVVLIALSIFSVVASCLLVYHYCFSASQDEVLFKEKNKKQVNSPHADIFKKNEKQNLLKDHIENPQKTAQKGAVLNKYEKIIDITPQVLSPQKHIWKAIVPSFPTRQTATEILSENDPFLQVLSPFDRQVRMKTKNAVSHEDFLSFYVKQIQECSPADRNLIKQSLEQINKKLKEYGIQLPETIHFIRTTGKEEIPNTAAYCKNQDVIVFNWMSAKLLAHELFHIYSRNNPEMRKKLYALVGYQLMKPLSIPDQLKDKRLVNPDVPYLDTYITVTYKGNKVQAVPMDLYDLNYKGPGKSRYLDGLYHKFALLEAKENGEMQFKLDKTGSPILFDFDEAEDLMDQIGENTSYIDSPEEILADNFALMIMGGQGKSPGLIEKMKACFKDNVRS